MQPSAPKLPTSERAAALTELVVVLPVFVAVIYASLYVVELGVFKIKALEISRYAAWSLATRPLSDFEAFDHGAKTRLARDAVAAEIGERYADLDGARARIQLQPGRSGTILAAAAEALGSSDLRSETVDSLPGALSADWASPLSAVGLILNFLGVGTGTQSFFAGPASRIGLHGRGEIHARANVRVYPPWRTADMRRGRAIASLGALRGADLRPWLPTSRRLAELGRGGGVRPIETVVIGDPWRVPDGASALPHHPGPFARVVARVEDRGLEALPLGPALSMILRLLNFREALPAQVGGIFGGRPAAPASHVVSRPYTEGRGGAAPPGKTGVGNRAGLGTTDVFADTGVRDLQERGAVRSFESLPLYDDFDARSPMLDALERRGANFLGCPESERRRCRW